MENPPLPENGKKKRCTVEETGSTPGLILGWAQQALEGIDQTFSREIHQQRKVMHREILEEVFASWEIHYDIKQVCR